jgi:hypothetical protein
LLFCGINPDLLKDGITAEAVIAINKLYTKSVKTKGNSPEIITAFIDIDLPR